MGYWNSRGLRGSALEELINFTNRLYLQKGIAVIQKIPTPITPVKLNEKDRTITLAYFDNKSTVDYIGVAQGVPICFDAKQTSLKSLPLQNIHEHQMEFMKAFDAQGGAAFLLVHFVAMNEYYLLPLSCLLKYYIEAQNGQRKSIPYQAFEKRYLIEQGGSSVLNYLNAVNIYLKAKADD